MENRLPRCIDPLLVAFVVFMTGAGADRAGSSNGDEPVPDPYPPPRLLLDRFRPYLRFSLDSNVDGVETIRPQTWQALYSQSTLYVNGARVPQTDVNLAEDPAAILDYADVREVNTLCGLDVCSCWDQAVVTENDDADIAGASWSDVAHRGHGLYGHVTQVPGTYSYVIEYWMLYAYNRTQDVKICAPLDIYCWDENGDHPFDLTSLTLTYDALTDRLVQVNYPVHGCMLMTFTLPEETQPPPSTDLESWTLPGPDGQRTIRARRIVDACYTSGGTCTAAGISDPFQSPADRYFYLAEGEPGVFEHPVVFIENGAHENWPNPTGNITLAPKHNGDYISFMPDPGVITLLDPTSTTPGPDDPFLFFAGHYGDPVGLVRHTSWYAPSHPHPPWLHHDRLCQSDQPDPYPWSNEGFLGDASFAGDSFCCGQCASNDYCLGWACAPKCGDGMCDWGESCQTCPQDCIPAGEKCCSNGVAAQCCVSTDCPSDGLCVNSFCVHPCGNGRCEPEYGENCVTCSQDCSPGLTGECCDDGTIINKAIANSCCTPLDCFMPGLSECSQHTCRSSSGCGTAGVSGFDWVLIGGLVLMWRHRRRTCA